MPTNCRKLNLYKYVTKNTPKPREVQPTKMNSNWDFLAQCMCGAFVTKLNKYKYVTKRTNCKMVPPPSWTYKSDFLAQYVWRTWIESTSGAQAQPRNQQTSKPTRDQQPTEIKIKSYPNIPKTCPVCHKIVLHNHKCPPISSPVPSSKELGTKNPDRTGPKSLGYTASHPTDISTPILEI